MAALNPNPNPNPNPILDALNPLLAGLNPLAGQPPQNPLIIGNKVMSTKPIKFVSYETIFYAETMLFHKDEFTDVTDNVFFKKLLSEYIPPNENTTPNTPAKYSLKYKYKTTTPQKTYEQVDALDNDDIFTGEIDTSLGATSPGIIQLTSIKDDTLTDPKDEKNIAQRFILIALYKELFKSSIINLWKTETDALFILPCFNRPDNGVSKLSTHIKEDIRPLYEAVFDPDGNKKFKTINFNKTIPP